MQPDRYVNLPPEPVLRVLTATARGMVGGSLERAAQQASAELRAAVDRAGHLAAVRSSLSLVPDIPRGRDDPDCRLRAGFLFGHDLSTLQGEPQQPEVALSGSLAWVDLEPGLWVVFSHHGSYSTLGETWRAIYGRWLPASGVRLRAAPPMELFVTLPDSVAPSRLYTEIWLPLAG